MRIESSFLQNADYLKSLNLQTEALRKVSENNRLLCLGFEYQSIITLGRRAVLENEILNSYHGFEVQKVDRGGRATLHNTGQLVIYPIFDLRYNNVGVREFIERLNRTNVKLFAKYGIKSSYSEDQGGVLTEKGKISFTGIRVERGCSSHGISINVSNNLSDFSNIVACGRREPSFDKIENYNTRVSVQEVFQAWIALVATEF